MPSGQVVIKLLSGIERPSSYISSKLYRTILLNIYELLGDLQFT